MNSLRHLAFSICLCFGALVMTGATPALAAPVWNLEMHHNQTNFSSAVPGSISVKTLTQGSPAASEVQEVALSAEAGNFSLGFNGDTTPELAFNATNGQVQSALRALPSIGGTNVKTQRSASESTVIFTVTFQGTLANVDVPQILTANGTPPLVLPAHAQYWFDLNNVGASTSSGQIELTIDLPAGLTSAKVFANAEFRALTRPEWECGGEIGATTVQCHTTSGLIPRHTIAHLVLEVDVEPSASGILTATATLQGGGAEKAASDSEPTEINSSPAGFGVVASSFVPDFFAADGVTVERAAGGHPNNLLVPVDFTSVAAPLASRPSMKRAAGSTRDLSVDLPPGFIGNPSAVGECSEAQFLIGECPASSQLGRFDGSLYTPAAGLAYNFSTGVFNMVHPRGAASDLGFQLASNPVHVKVTLDPENHYAITTHLADINEFLPPFGGKVTTWGIPADPSHDSERCPAFSAPITSGKTNEQCSTDHEVVPFITMPAQCEEDNALRLHHYDSWQTPAPSAPRSNTPCRAK